MGVMSLHDLRGGRAVKGTAGENLTNYDLVYLKDGVWWKADRDALASMPAVGMCTGTIIAGDSNYLLLWGIIGNPDWSWVNGAIYASATPGELTQTPPTTSGYVQSIGVSYGTTFMVFNPAWIKDVGATYTKHEHIDLGLFKIPAAATPNIVAQDNAIIFFFNQNGSEHVHLRWPKGARNYAGGDLKIFAHWTNDGGVDDNGKNVRWEISYQVVTSGGSIAGNHANSPKTINDTYTSDTGHLEHTSPAATIAAADFASAHGIIMKFTAIVPADTALTGEAGLLGFALEYEAYVEGK